MKNRRIKNGYIKWFTMIWGSSISCLLKVVLASASNGYMYIMKKTKAMFGSSVFSNPAPSKEPYIPSLF
jgi:hypothetical protein